MTPRAPMQGAVARASRSEIPGMREPVSILIVDDQPESLLALEALVGSPEVRLVRARSGRDALRCLLEEDFALILLDVQMPGMDGYETAEAIRERPQSRPTPIIFLTAMHGSETVLFRGYEAGAVDTLFKPIDPAALRSKVQVFVELARRERELRRANERLAAHVEDLETFVRSVSHDLKAPLRSLLGFATILEEEHTGALDATGRQHLGRVIGSARRMSAMVDALLALTRVTGCTISPVPIDLAPVAREILAGLHESAPERRAEFAVADALPARADPGLAAVLLDNLLRNAWKFTHLRERAAIEVGATGPAGPGRIYFVRDNGVGFRMETAARLFQPFERLHSAAEFEGTGVGLSICQRIVQRHGGRIWAESVPGEGATFRFTLG